MENFFLTESSWSPSAVILIKTSFLNWRKWTKSFLPTLYLYDVFLKIVPAQRIPRLLTWNAEVSLWAQFMVTKPIVPQHHLDSSNTPMDLCSPQRTWIFFQSILSKQDSLFPHSLISPHREEHSIFVTTLTCASPGLLDPSLCPRRKSTSCVRKCHLCFHRMRSCQLSSLLHTVDIPFAYIPNVSEMTS